MNTAPAPRPSVSSTGHVRAGHDAHGAVRSPASGASTSLARSAADRHDAAPARPCPLVSERPSAADRERECRDAECLAFFLALVTAALVMAGLTLATDLDTVARILLTTAAASLVGTLSLVLARPTSED